MSEKIEKTEKDKRGYIPIVIGFVLIIVGLSIVAFNVATNQFSAEGYLNRFNFWFVQAPISSCSIIVGSFAIIIGLLILKKINSILSYASVAFGFVLLLVDTYQLFVDWVRLNINIIGFDNFSSFSAGFFSYMMVGAFFMVVGVIIGLKIKNKLAYVTITGGLAIVLVGVSVLLVNLGDHLSTNYYLNLQLSWAPIISYSLIIGSVIVVIGAVYLIISQESKATRASKLKLF